MNRDKNKLASYSAFAAGFLLLYTNADAQLIYTNPDPDIDLFTPGFGGLEETYIDIDDNGVVDFRLTLFVDTICMVCPDSSFAKIYPLGSNEVIFQTAFASSSCGTEIFYYNIAQPFLASEMISSGADFFDDQVYLFNNDGGYTSCNVSSVGHHFTDDFVGIKLNVDGETHYGLIRLSIIGYTHLLIHDYAYEATPDTPIHVETLSNIPVIWEYVSDDGNNVNGTDLRYEYYKIGPEFGFIEYRIIPVKETAAADFTIDDALLLSPDQYKVETTSPTKFYDNTFDATTRDSDGDLITNNVPYKIFVWNFNDVAGGFPHELSSPSIAATLKTTMDEVDDLVLSDIGNNFDASDMQIEFEPSSTEVAVEKYKVIILKSPSDDFDIIDAFAIPEDNAVTVIPDGTPVSIILDPAQVDSEGNLIDYAVEYRAAVLTVNNGLGEQDRLSFSEPIILNGPTDVANDIFLSDIDNNNNASDIKVNLIKGNHPITVEEYRLLLVPAIDVDEFNITEALNAIPPEYYSFTPEPGGSYEIDLPYFTLDINGNSIIEGIGYYAYVLSIATDFGSSDILSLPSNELILQDQPLAIENETDSDFNVYYSNNALIINGNSSGERKIKVINNIGQTILMQSFTELETSFRFNHSKGIYFIVIDSEGKRVVKNIVVD